MFDLFITAMLFAQVGKISASDVSLMDLKFRKIEYKLATKDRDEWMNSIKELLISDLPPESAGMTFNLSILLGGNFNIHLNPEQVNLVQLSAVKMLSNHMDDPEVVNILKSAIHNYRLSPEVKELISHVIIKHSLNEISTINEELDSIINPIKYGAIKINGETEKPGYTVSATLMEESQKDRARCLQFVGPNIRLLIEQQEIKGLKWGDVCETLMTLEESPYVAHVYFDPEKDDLQKILEKYKQSLVYLYSPDPEAHRYFLELPEEDQKFISVYHTNNLQIFGSDSVELVGITDSDSGKFELPKENESASFLVKTKSGYKYFEVDVSDIGEDVADQEENINYTMYDISKSGELRNTLTIFPAKFGGYLKWVKEMEAAVSETGLFLKSNNPKINKSSLFSKLNSDLNGLTIQAMEKVFSKGPLNSTQQEAAFERLSRINGIAFKMKDAKLEANFDPNEIGNLSGSDVEDNSNDKGVKTLLHPDLENSSKPNSDSDPDDDSIPTLNFRGSNPAREAMKNMGVGRKRGRN